MSQEKVDLRKAQKAGRKKQNQREKRKKLAITIVVFVIALAILGWIGYSVFQAVRNKTGNSTQKEVDLDALQNYMEQIESEVSPEEDTAGGTTDTE